ncbi:MAG: tRNA (adenosine(37)-N6)-threonylcarbamoyltransferase complex dimerization subunit type 1 TsaB [Gemmatimonadota bacterium]
MTPQLLLAIDASAGPASVSLFRDGQLLGARRIDRTGSAELLAPTVAELLLASGLVASALTDIAVGGGPGSFTGLRVAAALAKGLARGGNATLHAVPSLPLIAAARDDAAPGTWLCVLDALRGEWFVQQVTLRADGRWQVDGAVERVPSQMVRDRALAIGATLVGPPIDLAQQPDARATLRIGITAVPRDTWEPNYGRLAEAQVVWEAANARALPSS